MESSKELRLFDMFLKIHKLEVAFGLDAIQFEVERVTGTVKILIRSYLIDINLFFRDDCHETKN